MSTKYPRPGPEIGVRAEHPKHGLVFLLDKIEGTLQNYWIVEDIDDDVYVVKEDDLSDYHVM